jgi:hypothetical protein
MSFTSEEYELHKQEVKRRSATQPVASSKMNLMASSLAATAPVTSPYINNYIGIDIAPVYQPNVDYAFLSKQTNFGFAAIKAVEVQEGVDQSYWGNVKFGDHIQNAHNAGVPEIPYIFLNPLSVQAKYGEGVTLDALKTLKRQDNIEYTFLQQTLNNKEYYAIAIDLERFWDSYTEYLAYLHGTITIDKVKVVSPMWIIADLKVLISHILEGMKAKELRTVPIIIYSGSWYIDAYLQSGNQNLFYNEAPNWEKLTFTGLDGLPKQQILFWCAKYTIPAIASWSDFLTKLPDGTTQKPYYGNFTRPFMWQVGVSAMDNGIYPKVSFDLDVALWPKDQFDKALSITRGTVVTPPPVTLTFSVSGKVTVDNVPLQNVAMTFGSLSTVTDANGVYTFNNVASGASATVYAKLDGYTFSPAIEITNITTNMINQNFSATKNTTPVEPPTGNVDLTVVNQKLDAILAILNIHFK